MTKPRPRAKLFKDDKEIVADLYPNNGLTLLVLFQQLMPDHNWRVEYYDLPPNPPSQRNPYPYQFKTEREILHYVTYVLGHKVQERVSDRQ